VLRPGREAAYGHGCRLIPGFDRHERVWCPESLERLLAGQVREVGSGRRQGELPDLPGASLMGSLFLRYPAIVLFCYDL